MKSCALFATFVTWITVSILHITDLLTISWANIYYNLLEVLVLWALSFLFCLRK